MKSSASKIVGLCQLSEHVGREKAAGKTVVHAHGVFDLIHPGHIRHLEAARRLGDVLVVTITPDAFVNKGPGRPVFTQGLRAEALAALSCVDYVAANEWPTAVEMITAIRPDVFVKGGEYQDASRDVTGHICVEAEAAARVGARLQFTHDITFSSTNLLNGFFGVFSEAATEYLRGLRLRVTSDQIVRAVRELAGVKVLLVGDTIIDEYHYVQPMAKTPKENLVANRYVSEERFAGGVLAAANHTASLCGRVDLVTCLGARESHEAFVRSRLKPHVGVKVFTRDDAPTVVKRRYVEESYKRKLFEVCFLEPEPLPEALERSACDYLETVLPNYDAVIVTDFGHGMIGQAMIKTLCERARFLAVNVQTNSANMGYNLITKYPRADYISVDAPEARLAVQDPRSDLPRVIDRLRARVDCGKIAITHGNHGCVLYDGDGGEVTKIPAFTTRVLDTVGAGDAFLAVSAPCVAAGMPLEWAGVLGNAAGALKVGIVGHRSSIEKVPLLKTVDALLK